MLKKIIPLIVFLILIISPQLYAAESAVVFMYHRFAESAYPSTNITLDQFDAQLEFLEENDYRIIPLSALVKAIHEKQTLPERTVALTADDAYLSIYTEAYPRLKSRGWSMTIFVNTDPVDQNVAGYLNWEQMREMKSNGIEFSNHGSSHDNLRLNKKGESHAMWRKRVIKDIEHAQKRLQEELGKDTNSSPKLFSYPYGEFNGNLKQVVSKLGYTAFGQQSGAIGYSSDTSMLPRFPMAERFSSLKQFSVKAAALPMPVNKIDPEESELGTENPPSLTLHLNQPLVLSCFLGSGAPLEIVTRSALSLTVRANRPLRFGRERYNCTAPSLERGRWYWYSHPWFNSIREE